MPASQPVQVVLPLLLLPPPLHLPPLHLPPPLLPAVLMLVLVPLLLPLIEPPPPPPTAMLRCRYNDFLAAETKRQWAWSKRYTKEMEWWSHVPPFIGCEAALCPAAAVAACLCLRRASGATTAARLPAARCPRGQPEGYSTHLLACFHARNHARTHACRHAGTTVRAPAQAHARMLACTHICANARVGIGAAVRADFAATVIYQAFMPVSFLAAVALPLWYSWVLWDDWWRSPVLLATLLMSPLKWVPWADKCLVWPGLV